MNIPIKHIHNQIILLAFKHDKNMPGCPLVIFDTLTILSHGPSIIINIYIVIYIP